MKKLFILFLFNLLADISSAQQVVFSEADRNIFQIRAKQLIEDFKMQLGTITSKAGVSDASKNAAMTSALEYFIGKGDAFEYTDEDDNKVRHKPVSVITQDKNGMLRVRYLKHFLKSLKYTTTQGEAIEIESIDIIVLENVNCEDGKCNAIASYFNKFSSNKDGHFVYQNVNEQRIRIPVEKTSYFCQMVKNKWCGPFI